MQSLIAKIVLLLLSSIHLMQAFEYQLPRQPMRDPRSKVMKLTWVPVVEPSDLRSAGSVVIGVRQAALAGLNPNVGPGPIRFPEQGPFYGMDGSLGAAAEGYKVVVPAPIGQNPEPRNRGQTKPIQAADYSSNIRTVVNQAPPEYERRPVEVKEITKTILPPPPAIQSSESVRSRGPAPVQNSVPNKQDSYSGNERGSAENQSPQEIHRREKEYDDRRESTDGYGADEGPRHNYRRDPHRDHHHHHHHHPHDTHMYEDHLHDDYIDPHELAQTGHAYAEELERLYGDEFDDHFDYDHSKMPFKYGGKAHSSRQKPKGYHKSKHVAPHRETHGDPYKPSKASNQEYEKKVIVNPNQSKETSGRGYNEQNPSTESSRVQSQTDTFNAQVDENVRYVARPPPPPPGLTQYRIESQGGHQVVEVPPPRMVSVKPQLNEVPTGYESQNDRRIKPNAQVLNQGSNYRGQGVSESTPTRIEDNRNYQLSSSQSPIIQDVGNSYIPQDNDYRRPNDDTQQEIPIDLRTLDRTAGAPAPRQNYEQAKRYETPRDQGRYETANFEEKRPRLANRNQGYDQGRQTNPPVQSLPPLVVVNNGESNIPTAGGRYESSTVPTTKSNSQPEVDIPNPQMLVIRTPPVEGATTGQVYEGAPRRAGERYSNVDEDAPEIDLRSGRLELHEGGNGYEENHPHSGLGVGIGFLDDVDDDEENEGEPQYKK